MLRLRSLFRRRPSFDSDAMGALLEGYNWEVMTAAGFRQSMDLREDAEGQVTLSASLTLTEGGRLRSISPTLNVVRSRIAMTEFVLATADALDCQDLAVLERRLADPALVLLGDAKDRDPRALMAEHAAAVVAALPDGWQQPLRDSPAARDAGWALVVGNELAIALLSDGWRRGEAELSTSLGNVATEVLSADELPPLPVQGLRLPRRHPERWRTAPAGSPAPT